MDRSQKSGDPGTLESGLAPVLQVFDPTCSQCGEFTFPGFESVFQRRVAEYTAKLPPGQPMVIPRLSGNITIRRWKDGRGIAHVLVASPELREVEPNWPWPVIDLGDGQ